MVRLMARQLRVQQGAAAIEAMGAMVVFLAALILATYMGITFYNMNVLNSAAQNITLNTQVQLDRWCAPNQADECGRGVAAASRIRQEIMANTRNELAFATVPTVAPTLNPPTGGSVAWPAGTVNPGRGWGYNTAEISTTQTLFGNPNLPAQFLNPLVLRSFSMSTSYKDPDQDPIS